MKRLTYQFSNVSEVWTLDPTVLRPLHVMAGGAEAELHPPDTDNAMVPFVKSIDGQPISMTIGLMRVVLSLDNDYPEPDWRIPYEFVIQCLSWVRVATRQYWVGNLPNPQSTSPRAFLLREVDSAPEPVIGLGALRAGARWIPLGQETWEAIEIALRKGWWPSVSEHFLLDSSLHLGEGNSLQAVAGMGIACEVELNSLLDDMITRLGQQALTTLYKANRSSFSWKLRNLPQLLGAPPFSSTNPDRVMALEEMYERRGQIVHRGGVPLRGDEIARYWFAAEEFFAWSRNERMRLGIWPDLHAIYRSLEQGRNQFAIVI